MWIRRLGEERLLSRGEQNIGWRKDPRPRPCHLGDAILEEQRPALVVGSPQGGAVHHRLGEQYDRPRRHVRNDHAGGLFRGLVDLARQLEVTLVTPGNAPESSAVRSGIGKTPRHNRESLVDAVGGKVKALSWLGEGVESRSSVVRMHGPHGLPLVHADPVETVQPKALPEPKAKNRHDRLMIQQATERLPPVEEAMMRSVLAGSGAKADVFAGAGEPLRFDQSVQLGHLRRSQDVVDHQIALKVEKVLLQLLVRSVHGHTLPCLCCHRRLYTTLYRSSESPTDLVRASTLTCLRRRRRIPVIRLAIGGRNAMSEARFTTLTPLSRPRVHGSHARQSDAACARTRRPWALVRSLSWVRDKC